jgi:hypothetical protein
METPRIRLPNLVAGQAQKELTVNEALHALDAIVCGVIETAGLGPPPELPAVASSYLVGASTGADWSGREGQVATFTVGGWRYLVPFDGLTMLVKLTGETHRYRDRAWDVMLGPQQPAIANIAGGTTVDVEARAAVGAILSALRAHGLIAA